MTARTGNLTRNLIGEDGTIAPVFWVVIGISLLALILAALLGPLFMEAAGQ